MKYDSHVRYERRAERKDGCNGTTSGLCLGIREREKREVYHTQKRNIFQRKKFVCCILVCDDYEVCSLIHHVYKEGRTCQVQFRLTFSSLLAVWARLVALRTLNWCTRSMNDHHLSELASTYCTRRMLSTDIPAMSLVYPGTKLHFPLWMES